MIKIQSLNLINHKLCHLNACSLLANACLTFYLPPSPVKCKASACEQAKMHGDIIVAKIAAVYNYSVGIEEFEHATIRTYTKFVLYFVNYLSQAAT